ncbi:MAG: type II secretion system protein [Deltaproteobacteria bacterium]|nr:type II secretion system protein [Deltaproteobacteria bacterium]
MTISMRHSPRHRPTSRDGFTLVEVVVSIGLLTVGLLATASTLMAIYNGQRSSAAVMVATQLAESAMEDVKSRGYDEVIETNEPYGGIPDYATYARNTTVTTNADDNLKTVRIQVWSSQGVSVVLDTLVARR